MSNDSIDRRDFIKLTTAAMLAVFSEEELLASGLYQTPQIAGAPVKIGVIGIGQWGKEVLATLARLPAAQVTAICDTYEAYLKRGLEIAPKAGSFSDYRKVLESSDVEAVVICTPSHQHKEIALAALQAGKHVYCEAPLASTIEDAKAIALVASQSSKQIFQAGLQGRSNALYNHVLQFVKSGVLGTPAQVVAQWNKKLSWRRAAPTPERERELNWRLYKTSSAGLAGEIGVHQLDLVNWYLKGLPTAVGGFGSIINWKDERETPDTVQGFLEYPNNVKLMLTMTLVSSFSESFTLFQGSNASLMMREKRGWMMKEADSPLLGWEVYAKKEEVHNESTICMVADATKLLEAGKEPGKEGALEPTQTAIYRAFENFARSIRENQKLACGAMEAYQATVLAIKTNEAILAGNRLVLDKSLFELK
ncbi:MAG: Gfo/Idh/MocA family oxidoreductase [Acidobacteriota bacterium]